MNSECNSVISVLRCKKSRALFTECPAQNWKKPENVRFNEYRRGFFGLAVGSA
jgi:hypothetical protein